MNNTIHRPWGSFVVITKNRNFLIKKITVKPEGVLSYQSHEFRSEHWVIISGKATIIIDNKKYLKLSNENIFIKKKAKHRIINKSKKTKLVFIEVQTGTKFLESDIKRFSDVYGRS